jgi:hypothetical protein
MTKEPRVVLEIRAAKDSLISPVAFVNLLASLKNTLKTSFWERLFGEPETISFEITCLNQTVFFVVTCPEKLDPLIRSQIAAHYPDAVITHMNDYLPTWLAHGQASLAQLTLAGPYYLPLNTIKDDKLDPLASILGVLSKTPLNQAATVQLCLSACPNKWHSAGRQLIQGGSDPEKKETHPQKALIEQKIGLPAFDVDIRLAAITSDKAISNTLLSQMAAAFGVYTLSESNALKLKRLKPNSEQKLATAMINRSCRYTPAHQHLNLLEIASLYHFPNNNLTGIKNIAWGKTLKGEPPANLPTPDGLTDEEKRTINFYGRTEFKNRLAIFGIKRGEDRRRHMYILGKSGTGKTTLIANMAIADIRNREGVIIVDPHGDLSETLLDFIPSYRINDIAYLDPADRNQSFHLNPLYIKNPEHKELVASGVVSIFYKIYGNSWGPRLEYVLRNAILTLVSKPGATFLDIPRLLTNPAFRNKYIESLTDETLVRFWTDEYDKYSEKFQAEVIAPILNKVGQFITSPTIRNIVGHSESTIDLEEMINLGKIVILNVSQGKIGEDNAALLGAMFITQIQIAAMNRVNIPESERKDVFLYVDEFQNFATTSFIKILSEARKFRLNLILANQYTAQLPEEIQNAIFGNAGTICSFVVGAEDATRLVGQFGDTYTQNDLVNLVKYQIINKLTVDGAVSMPFPGYTLPLPFSKNQNKEKVLRISHERFYKPIPKIDTLPIIEKVPSNTSSSPRYSSPSSFQKSFPPRSYDQRPGDRPRQPYQHNQPSNRSSFHQNQNRNHTPNQNQPPSPK